MRLIDADELIKDRVENDPVRIAAECAPTAFDKEKMIKIIACVNRAIAVGDKNALYWMAKLEEIVRKAGTNETISGKRV